MNPFSSVTDELKSTFDKKFYEKAQFIPSAKETVELFLRV